MISEFELPKQFDNRFSLIRPLGSGGEARTFLGRDEHLSRDVVLKLRPLTDDINLARLRREARILVQLAPHKALPVIRNDVVEHGWYVLVSDYVPGNDLATVLRARGDPGLPAPEVIRYLDLIAEALDHLHRNHHPPVVHGDVKPSNIVVGDDGRVVLVDFGTAVRAGEAGGRIGTPGFTAPEIVTGEVARSAADVYSLAATAYALLTGTPAMGGTTSWDGIRPAVAAGLERVIRQALAFDPMRRPRLASDLVAHLRQAVEMEMPSGTITLCQVQIEGGDDLRPVRMDALALLESHGGFAVPIEVGRESVVVGFAGAAAALAAADVLGSSPSADRVESWRIGLLAADLGGWHGDTVERAVADLFEMTARAPARSIVCAPTVRMLVAGRTDRQFEAAPRGFLVRAVDRSSNSTAVNVGAAWVTRLTAMTLFGRDRELSATRGALKSRRHGKPDPFCGGVRRLRTRQESVARRSRGRVSTAWRGGAGR